MNKVTRIALAGFVALALAACSDDEAQITTTTLDASLLTTTTTIGDDGNGEEQPPSTDTSDTTAQPSDEVESFEVISRQSTEDGETLYILIPPGNYSDVSIENFLGDLLEDETAVSGVEVFDDRAALDASLKAEDERTAEEMQTIEDHHLVSLVDGRQVAFQGPLSDYEDFVIGS
ncbi:MAG TPA: hypothetical protein VLB85_08320 [Acidimicrobiia bacterium]|nr:hypothetical protein [Acidimicrobiia bacterium]